MKSKGRKRVEHRGKWDCIKEKREIVLVEGTKTYLKRRRQVMEVILIRKGRFEYNKDLKNMVLKEGREETSKRVLCGVFCVENGYLMMSKGSKEYLSGGGDAYKGLWNIS